MWAIVVFAGLMLLCIVSALIFFPLGSSKTTNDKLIGLKVVCLYKGCNFALSDFDIYSVYKNNVEVLEVHNFFGANPNDLKRKLKELAWSRGKYIPEEDVSDLINKCNNYFIIYFIR